MELCFSTKGRELSYVGCLHCARSLQEFLHLEAIGLREGQKLTSTPSSHHPPFHPYAACSTAACSMACSGRDSIHVSDLIVN